MHSQRREIKADHGPERPALGAFHQSLQPELCVGTICTCTVTRYCHTGHSGPQGPSRALQQSGMSSSVCTGALHLPFAVLCVR